MPLSTIGNRTLTLPLAVSMGEPAGIAPDVTLLSWAHEHASLPPFYVVGDPALYRARSKSIGLDITVKEIETPRQALSLHGHALAVLPVDGQVRAQPGKPNAEDASLVLQALQLSINACKSGEASGLVTGPIHKKSLYQTGFNYQGHTDFLAAVFQTEGTPINEVMMLCTEAVDPPLRVVPVTIHNAVADVSQILSTEKIIATGMTLNDALQTQFGITTPNIAVAALNPHAGESGAMGDEEATVIKPAIQALQASGINASGPYPADTLFHAENRHNFDAVLCMYHDQALIPLKTLDFYGGINVTLGLPIIRTSPDHGTAFEIASTGKAKPDSMIAALKLAGRLAQGQKAKKPNG